MSEVNSKTNGIYNRVGGTDFTNMDAVSTSGKPFSYGPVFRLAGQATMANRVDGYDTYFLGLDSGRGLWLGTKLNNSASVSWRKV